MRSYAHAVSVLSLVAAAGFASLASTGCSVSSTAVTPALPQPAALAHREVELGYALYGDLLAPYGTWEADAANGARWCPSAEVGGGPGFEPYVSRGRWVLSSESVGGMSAGTPRWRSDDADTWGEITTHHGWWTKTGSEWCWVPGSTPTPASVVWTTDADLVGWAPALPPWAVVDDDDVDDARYSWSFSLLGTLCDGYPDQDRLGPDALREARARNSASALTAKSRGSATARPQHVGPSAGQILAARSASAALASAHPGSALAAAYANAGSAAAAARHARGSGGTTSGGGHGVRARGTSRGSTTHKASSHASSTKKHHR